MTEASDASKAAEKLGIEAASRVVQHAREWRAAGASPDLGPGDPSPPPELL
jgi:hypothetical protein